MRIASKLMPEIHTTTLAGRSKENASWFKRKALPSATSASYYPRLQQFDEVPSAAIMFVPFVHVIIVIFKSVFSYMHV